MFVLKIFGVVSWAVSWSDFQAFLFTCWQRSFYSFASYHGLSVWLAFPIRCGAVHTLSTEAVS